MNIYKIYRKNKRANKKNKDMALLYTKQDLSELISKANFNNGFVDTYACWNAMRKRGRSLKDY